MRLIDADALVNALSVDTIGCAGCPEPEFMEELLDILDTAPTVDAIPKNEAIEAVELMEIFLGEDNKDAVIRGIKALPFKGGNNE